MWSEQFQVCQVIKDKFIIFQIVMTVSLLFFTVTFTIIIILITSYYLVYLTFKISFKKVVIQSIFVKVSSFQAFLFNAVSIFL